MEDSGLVPRSSALYLKYGNNEPYTEPEDDVSAYRNPKEGPKIFFELMTGASTNFYVGPEHKHYTIPKRLIYHFSDYARVCLEGSFSETAANAIWLPDIDPDVFQFLWQWLYSGKLSIHRYCTMDDDWRNLNEDEQCQRVCQLLCRVHMLGERLLFDWRFLLDVQRNLDALLEKVKHSPFTPKILQEVFSESAPVELLTLDLRGFVLNHWMSFDLCTTIDYYEYVECFEQDGAFAAKMMAYMASELKWVVERWEKETQSTVDVNAKKKQHTEEHGFSQYVERIERRCGGVWLACRYMCTWTGCTTTDFRSYSQCFELDGAFAAKILEYMAGELLWVVHRWGKERGRSVDFAAEKEKEEYEDAMQSLVDKAIRRSGWS